MDNIIDYLVIGFFVISFLSSIFKKKKVKTKPQKVVNTTSESNQRKALAQKPKAKNPFDDFFKSINEEIEKAKAEVSRSEVDEYYEQALQNSDDNETIEKNTFEQIEGAPLIPEAILSKEDGTNSIKSYTESVKFSELKRESKKAKSIKRQLLQKDSIKDFILLNEILGKPKALQR